MKIAIHHSPGSFSDRWIDYCNQEGVSYKIVNCYSNSIIRDIEDCDALMWHFSNYNYRDMIMARHVLFTAQQMGKKVFPDYYSSWHFDDKVAQKYLLESINAPLVDAYAFFNKKEAFDFLEKADFPIVFKLRKGAGGKAVRLVKNKVQAKLLVKKAFGRGIPQMSFLEIFLDRFQKYKQGLESLKGLLKGLFRIIIKSEYYKMTPPEKGYVYFQKFVPGCSSDIRLKVIGDKCWGFTREVRKGDFRASGSDIHNYSPEKIPLGAVKWAFEIAEKLKLQNIAFDFVVDQNASPLVIEMSYGYGWTNEQFNGFWDKELNRHEDNFNPFGWMIEDLLK